MLSRKDVRKALKKKGFVEGPPDRDHDTFVLETKPLQPVWTALSRGTKYKDLGPDLVKAIREEIRLDTKRQLEEYVQCQLSKKCSASGSFGQMEEVWE